MPQHEILFIETLGDLYTDVQSQKIFPDSKYFVDSIPNKSPALIVALYKAEKKQPGFSLEAFVQTHFTLPATTGGHYDSGKKPIVPHLEELWDELTREPAAANGSTLVPLPYAYVVPGGRFREIYYWDSYFTMLGLQVSRRIDHIQDMVDNFAYLIDTFGFIANGNRSYYLGRSQPPFFTLMVELLAEEKGKSVLLKYLPQLEKEYAYWMNGEQKLSLQDNSCRRMVLLPDGSILNRYWDDNNMPRPESYREDNEIAEGNTDTAMVFRHIRAACESGWDFSSRWFANEKDMHSIQTAHIVPVDLNCLILHFEETLQKIYALKNEPEMENAFAKKASNRKKAIQQYCWNEEQGFYFDYHWKDQNIMNRFSLAAVYALFFFISTKEQAAKTAIVLEQRFLQIGGLLTTLHHTGQQWDAPNGWAPLQWMAYKGLKNYGHDELADRIRERWMTLNENVYNSTGKMMEKYDVSGSAGLAGGGEYPNQDGFGWTNGVYLKFTQEG